MKLRQKDIHISWERLREMMSTHIVITSEMKTMEQQNILYKLASEPKYFHIEIYKAQNITRIPKKKRALRPHAT